MTDKEANSSIESAKPAEIDNLEIITPKATKIYKADNIPANQEIKPLEANISGSVSNDLEAKPANNNQPIRLGKKGQPLKTNRSEEQRAKNGKRYKLPTRLTVKALKGIMPSLEVAKQTGISERAVYRIWNDKELNDLIPSAVTAIKSGLKGILYKRALQSTMAMTPEKYSQASLLQLATTSGIMIDKARILNDESSYNVTSRSVIEHINSEMHKISEELGGNI
jgi:hypothetical protein